MVTKYNFNEITKIAYKKNGVVSNFLYTTVTANMYKKYAVSMHISSKIVQNIYSNLIKAKMALSRSTADESMTYLTNKHFFQQKVLCNTLQKSPSPN